MSRQASRLGRLIGSAYRSNVANKTLLASLKVDRSIDRYTQSTLHSDSSFFSYICICSFNLAAAIATQKIEHEKRATLTTATTNYGQLGSTSRKWAREGGMGRLAGKQVICYEQHKTKEADTDLNSDCVSKLQRMRSGCYYFNIIYKMHVLHTTYESMPLSLFCLSRHSG